MSNVPDAWDDEWSSVADKLPTPPESAEPKKVSSKVTKAQKRAQQAEFNRQLWAEAEGPKKPNYFLESRKVVPLRSEFKPPTVLLSRKGPVIQSRKPPTETLENLDLNKKDDSSEDEDDVKERERTLAERQAQAAKDREERQRKYEERRQELFGGPSTSTTTNMNPNNLNGGPTSRSGNSSPGSLTPPGSRSSTPNRGRGRGGRRGAANPGLPPQARPQQLHQPEVYDPIYAPKPDSTYLQRRENGPPLANSDESQPIRAPKGPDGSGRGGFGFAGARRGKQPSASDLLDPTLAAESVS